MPSQVGGDAIVSDPIHRTQRIAWQPGGPANRPTGIGQTATQPLASTCPPAAADTRRGRRVRQHERAQFDMVGWEALTRTQPPYPVPPHLRSIQRFPCSPLFQNASRACMRLLVHAHNEQRSSGISHPTYSRCLLPTYLPTHPRDGWRRPHPAPTSPVSLTARHPARIDPEPARPSGWQSPHGSSLYEVRPVAQLWLVRTRYFPSRLPCGPGIAPHVSTVSRMPCHWGWTPP